MVYNQMWPNLLMDDNQCGNIAREKQTNKAQVMCKNHV
jgi:hypothetical protein